MSELDQELERDVKEQASPKEKVEKLLDNIRQVVVNANGDEEELAELLDCLAKKKAHLAELAAS